MSAAQPDGGELWQPLSLPGMQDWVNSVEKEHRDKLIGNHRCSSGEPQNSMAKAPFIVFQSSLFGQKT
jgi:hypothetical protein